MTCDSREKAQGLSYFSITTGKLAEVMCGREYCTKSDITMLCSYVMANNRYSKIPNTIFGENKGNRSAKEERVGDDSFQDKINCEVVNDKLSNNTQMYDDDSEKICAVLKNIGFVCFKSDMKMYTIKLSKIFYYIPNIKDYNPYRNYLTSKPSNSSMCNSNNPSIGDIDQDLTSCSLSPVTSHCNNIDDIRNFYKELKANSKNTSSNCTTIKKDMRHSSHRKNMFSNGCQKGVPMKYWSMRYTLFSKYDLGIQLDPESFYSVCPEVLSYHIAKRCKSLIALDPFCGAGGNIIQLALTCKLVIAIDIDPNKIKLARHNAEIYGVADKIEFIVGDFFDLAPLLKADVVFMSPPWGGPGYWINEVYSIESMCEKHYGGGFGIFHKVKSIAPSIAFHLPKTTNIYECLWLADDFGRVEIQQNIINGKLNSITAFYGPFIDVTDNDY